MAKNSRKSTGKQSQKKTTQKKNMATWKPGSEPEKAKEVASEHDFGAAKAGSRADRDYVRAIPR